MMNRISTRDICLIGVFAAIMCVVSQLSIPMPYGVPMTLQTLIMPIAGIVLGAKKGTAAAIIYVLLGAVGLPVFSSFSAGMSVVLGPRGGFILSFPLMSLAAGLAVKRGSRLWLAIGLIAGVGVNFLCGAAMYYIFVSGATLHMTFLACVMPFIPTAIAKIIIAGILGVKLREALKKSKLLAE